jgi:hypothetical protein
MIIPLALLDMIAAELVADGDGYTVDRARGLRSIRAFYRIDIADDGTTRLA